MYIEMEKTDDEIHREQFKVHFSHMSGEAVKSSEIL